MIVRALRDRTARLSVSSLGRFSTILRDVLELILKYHLIVTRYQACAFDLGLRGIEAATVQARMYCRNTGSIDKAGGQQAFQHARIAFVRHCIGRLPRKSDWSNTEFRHRPGMEP
jgi:hypothetical protein